MSSAIVVKAIEKEAAKTGLAINIKSIGSGEYADEVKNGWDAVLVAPQVRFRLADFQEAAAGLNIPVAVMPPQAYSPLGGAKALEEIHKILG
jgi:PTS system cellobiose-specific IIB component